MLRSYWVLVVMDQFTRRLDGVGVQHAVHDVLVDVDPERVRDDTCNPWTAEPRIARRELDD